MIGRAEIVYAINDQGAAAGSDSNVVMDPNGNLYGTVSTGWTPYLCSLGCGAVWEIAL